MAESRDFAIDPEDRGPAPEAKAPPAPRVVIEYRNRGLSALLVPPLLILVAALGILSYRRQTPIPALASVTTPAPEAPERRAKPEPAAAKAPSPPAVARPERAPAPESTPSAVPVATAAPSTVAEEKKESAPNDPPAQTASVESAPPASPPPVEPDPKPSQATPKPVELPTFASVPAESPEPAEPSPTPVSATATRQQVMDDIMREAEEKEAQVRELEATRPQLMAMEFSRLVRANNEARVPFHRDLRETLRKHGSKAGPEIETLCDVYGRTTRDEIKAAVTKLLRRSYASLGRASRVAMMRSVGYPEPMILEYLANEMHSSIKSRGGPRDEDEVWIRAAQLLLRMPPRPPASAGRPPGQPVVNPAPPTVPGNPGRPR